MIEICIDNPQFAPEIVAGGASRIELCRDLASEGLSPELIDCEKITRLGVDVHVMVRPCRGAFAASEETLKQMQNQIEAYKEVGVNGFVFGLLDENGEVNRAQINALVEVADSLPVCFHRAFDLIDDKIGALKTLRDLGVRHVLTAGGKGGALNNLNTLQKLVLEAGEHIELIVGGGVRANNLLTIHNKVQASAYHSALDRKPTRAAVSELVNLLN